MQLGYGNELPKEIAEMPMVNADVDSVEKAGDVDLVFSVLPGDLAGPVEASLPRFTRFSARRALTEWKKMFPALFQRLTLTMRIWLRFSRSSVAGKAL